MTNYKTKIAKVALIMISIISIFSTIIVMVVPTYAASATAYCGADSYVDCWGGVRCTETDNVGCKCYDAHGKVVMSKKCLKEDMSGEIDLPEDSPSV